MVHLQNGYPNPPPRRSEEIESSKHLKTFLTTSHKKHAKIFLTFACTLRKSFLRVDPGSQKLPNLVILQQKEKLSVKPARQLIFSLKNLPSIVLTGNCHIYPGKNSNVEKNDLKVTKNRFFFRKWNFDFFRQPRFSIPNIQN